ncbi:hypothetical protein ACPW96_08465 [Micromonospora sp. DT81.3]|uniref:hypothetical protein n=1 Tax=Micromonospora sp. DT81.3 TaxID=3416523 RepID=UPI003CE7DD32
MLAAKTLDYVFRLIQLRHPIQPGGCERHPVDTNTADEHVDSPLPDFFKAEATGFAKLVRTDFNVAPSLRRNPAPGNIRTEEGTPPDADDNMHRPIANELDKSTGTDLGEVPVGDPWEPRLPMRQRHPPVGKLPTTRRRNDTGVRTGHA